MERKEMEFGKKFRAGNFEYLKIVKTLNKRELAELRNQAGIPLDIRKHLNRGGLPYMVINSISGGWSLSLACGTAMYSYIEFEHFKENGDKSLHNLFTMMYSDTAVMGDQEYWQAKADALKAFMERQKKPVSKEEDDKELETLKTEHEARENLEQMVEEAKKGDDDVKQE